MGATKYPYESNNLAIVIKTNTSVPSTDARLPRWKLVETNWPMFEPAFLQAYVSLDNINLDDICETLSEHIIDAATPSNSRTSGRFPIRLKTWWNEVLSPLRKERNNASKNVSETPNT